MFIGSTSICSRMFKTEAWKIAKAARHAENVRYRADLHRAKAGAPAHTHAEIQRKIDEISRRG